MLVFQQLDDGHPSTRTELEIRQWETLELHPRFRSAHLSSSSPPKNWDPFILPMGTPEIRRKLTNPLSLNGRSVYPP